MKPFLDSFLRVWREFTVGQKTSIILAALLVIGGLTAVAVWSGQPDYQLLYGRLAQKDAAVIISSLQTQNIKYRTSPDGSSVYVPAENIHRLRMDLASKGLPSGEGVGFEIFDKGQFGLSDFAQRTNYARALQGELSRTIAQLDGVAAARVMIVQPENRLLLVGQSIKPTASVFVELRGNRLPVEAVNAIRNLVANSVQGLLVDEVAVIDQKGHVLSADLKDDPTLGAATSQMRYRQQVEDYFARKVESLLTPVIGPGNAVVRVSADIDSETANRSEERFDPEGQVVRSQTNIEETSTSVEKKKSGVAGVTSNTPDAAKDEAPLVANDQNTKNRTTSYEINRVLTNTSRTPGTIRGLSASVFVAQRMVGIGADAKPQPRTAEELQGLRKLVINAIGLKAFAGANANANVEDLVTIQEAAFQSSFPAASADDVAVPTKVRTWIELGAKYLPVLIAVLAFGFFFRLLRTQRPETVPMEVINPPREEEQSELPAVVTAATLNELLRKKPANIGAALRGWTAEAKS
jgi:flagellar M-ring protein FliF